METSITLDEAARSLLRQVAAHAGDRRARLADLREVLDAPSAETAPAATLRADAQLRAVLDRASTLASDNAAESTVADGLTIVGVPNLVTALAELELVSAGLDARRLAHARNWVRHRYSTDDRNRVVVAEPSPLETVTL
jgi:hypothetical protein